VITLVSSCFTSLVFSDNSIFVSGALKKVVNDENELVNAINNSAEHTVIALNRDIKLTSTLIIPTGKEITLTSNSKEKIFKLIGSNITGTYTDSRPEVIGTDGTSTIIIGGGGILTLNGIVVTHEAGATGVGVNVNAGKLTMIDGEIIGNNAEGRGGGVFVDYLGSFELFGGIIANNTAQYGGGVYAAPDGTFNMFGGVIVNNTATSCGGGVFSLKQKSLVLSDGLIASNTAGSGGGIYMDRSVISMSGGVIANNTARGGGGGVYVTTNGGSLYEGIFTITGGIIANNTAIGEYNGGGGVST